MILLALLSAPLLARTGHESPPPRLQDAPPTTPQWKGTLALGGTWTEGNTETQSFAASFNAERRAEKDRWTFDAFANYGSSTELVITPPTFEEEKDTTVNNSGGGVKYDYFWTPRTYLYGNSNAKVDHIAALDLRWTVGTGVGYQWKETEKIKWGTDVGLSYVDEDLEGTSDDTEFLAARLASNLAYQISKTAAFEQVAEILPSLEDSEDVIARVDNRLKLNITGKWIAMIQYVLDFDGSPLAGPLGPGIPDGKDETDHRVVLSVGWNFGPEK